MWLQLGSNQPPLPPNQLTSTMGAVFTAMLYDRGRVDETSRWVLIDDGGYAFPLTTLIFAAG